METSCEPTGLPLACTGEYAQFHGGTVTSVLAAMNTSMVRVNGVFERDVAIRMVIVDNNDQLVFLNASNRPLYQQRRWNHAGTEHQHMQ
jgi:hypothetical protein